LERTADALLRSVEYRHRIGKKPFLRLAQSDKLLVIEKKNRKANITTGWNWLIEDHAVNRLSLNWRRPRS
jgi:hypothetical protein